ncbi:MAG: NfeD family protein [Gammaproteobacteria bacterium]|nr:NfeD family protein [Gammaproteobacteria bacterium]
MPWWAWIITGLALMGLEMLAVDAAFYLIFIGVAALIIGLLEPLGVTLGLTAQWIAFAVLALTLMVLFRERLYKKLRGGAVGFEDSTIGSLVDITGDVAPGGSTRVRMRGSEWTAINIGQETIPAGRQARIKEVDGLILKVTSQLQE